MIENANNSATIADVDGTESSIKKYPLLGGIGANLDFCDFSRSNTTNSIRASVRLG